MLIFAVIVLVLLIAAFFYGRKLGKAESAGIVEEKPQITQDILHQQLEGLMFTLNGAGESVRIPPLHSAPHAVSSQHNKFYIKLLKFYVKSL